MQLPRSPLKEALPSFSLVLETENLASAAIDGLSQSLDSLLAQSISPTAANEVLIIDSGYVPGELLTHLRTRYPWLKVHQPTDPTSYYKAKMLGATLVTGQVIVYCDSDCIYEQDWLLNLLRPFTQSDDIQVVAGETTTYGWGPYGTAMALTYIFPPFSNAKVLAPTAQYFLNNVAFRRDFLLQTPIPTDLSLYRGHCVIHAQRLRQQGYTIWQQPNARARHAPPSSPSHFFWRFLLIGHDYYWQNQLLASPGSDSDQLHPTQAKLDDHAPTAGFKGKLAIFNDRIRKMIQHDRRHLLYFPFAVPIVLTAAFLIFVGYSLTASRSDYLLKHYSHVL